MGVRLKVKTLESCGATFLQQWSSVTRSTSLATPTCLLLQDRARGRSTGLIDQPSDRKKKKTRSSRRCDGGGVAKYLINPSRYPPHMLRSHLSSIEMVNRDYTDSNILPSEHTSITYSPSSSSSSSSSLGQRIQLLELPSSVVLSSHQPSSTPPPLSPPHLSETLYQFFSSSSTTSFSSSPPPPPLPPPSSPHNDKPTPAQLAIILLKLREEMPVFFSGDHGTELYAADIVFENSLGPKPWTVQGSTAYVALLTSWRVGVKTCFSCPQLDLLKISKNVEEGKIEARWRVRGRPRTPWSSRDKILVEAFSTFHVRADGNIAVHKLDKVMPGGKEPNRVMSWLARVGVALIPSSPHPSP